MVKEKFDYDCVKPDQSVIEIKRSPREIVGEYVWNDDEHKYNYLGKLMVTEIELVEILQSIKRLNKEANLPQWLNWGMHRK